MSDQDIVPLLRDWSRSLHQRGADHAPAVLDDAVDEIARLRAEVARLRLTEAEREVLTTVRDIYSSHDDDESCARIAAVIDGLLARHGGAS